MCYEVACPFWGIPVWLWKTYHICYVGTPLIRYIWLLYLYLVYLFFRLNFSVYKSECFFLTAFMSLFINTWLLFRTHAIWVIMFPLCMQNKTVSVFETNIRILGGLLSAHLIASDYATVCLLNPISSLLWLLYVFTYFLITSLLVWHEKYTLIDINYDMYLSTA